MLMRPGLGMIKPGTNGQGQRCVLLIQKRCLHACLDALGCKGYKLKASLRVNEDTPKLEIIPSVLYLPNPKPDRAPSSRTGQEFINETFFKFKNADLSNPKLFVGKGRIWQISWLNIYLEKTFQNILFHHFLNEKCWFSGSKWLFI